jgi:tetratricopeptide (TPR) repeat protein
MSPLFGKKKVGPEYYFERGENCLKSENLRWALESFTKAIEFNPSFEMAYYKRAEVYKKLGENRKAVEDYAAFLESDSRVYESAEELRDLLPASLKNAQLMLQRDKARNEIRSFGTMNIIKELMREYTPQKNYLYSKLYQLLLSDLKKSYPKQIGSMGFVHLLRGDLSKAVEEFDKALKEAPGNSDLHYFKGVALLKKTEESRQKGVLIRGNKQMGETWAKAHSSFMEALKTGFSWSLCAECGYRTKNPELNFCMHCGKKLLTSN